MLIIAIMLLAIAALLGLYLISFVLQEKNTPKGIAFIHGPLAALGLILLIIYAILYRPQPIISILIFLLAAIFGLILIFRDLTGKSIPKWFALAHGVTAVIGFSFLLFFIFF